MLLFIEKEIGRRIPCSYSTPRLANPESVRAHPFYTTEPSEEEKEEMEKFREEAREGVGGVTKTSDNPIAQELLKAAKALDGKLDFSSNAGRKKAVGEFVALVDGKVDLPQNRNPKMEIGKLVMANCTDKSAEEIMQVIFDKYGFANVKQEKAAAKEAAAEAVCGNPKNAAMVLAFSECMKVRDIQIYCNRFSPSSSNHEVIQYWAMQRNHTITSFFFSPQI